MLDRRLHTLALVVPSLTKGGGVPSVARFVKDTVLRSGRFKLKLVSLAMSARDPVHLNLTRPGTWLRGATTAPGEWEGLPFVRVGAVAGEFEFQRYRPRAALRRALADCDLIQVVCGSPAWANAVCGMGKPVSVQCATRAKVERRRRDGSPAGLAGQWRKLMTRVTDRYDDRALHSVDAIQVENPWMLEYAERVNRGRKVDIRYAPPGVDARSFHPLPTRQLAFDPYILCVGRLDDPRKNVELLLEAYARMPQRLRDQVQLILAGSSGPSAAFWVRVTQLGLAGRVAFVERPSRDELIALYQKAAVFALASDEEGLGVVLLEAMACGVPVVSTRSGGPDGIITDGSDGFLVPLDDVQALSDRLGRLCVDHGLNVVMGGAARRTVERKYAEDVAAQAFLDVWDRLLAAGRRQVTVPTHRPATRTGW